MLWHYCFDYSLLLARKVDINSILFRDLIGDVIFLILFRILFGIEVVALIWCRMNGPVDDARNNKIGIEIVLILIWINKVGFALFSSIIRDY